MKNVKTKLIVIGLFLFLIGIIVYLFGQLKEVKIDRDIQHNNSVELLTEKDQVITITKQSLRDTIENNKVLRDELKKERIKKNKIITITQTKFEYIPSAPIVIKMIEQDTMKYLGTYADDCLVLDSCVFDMRTKQLFILKPKFTNEITNVVYMKKKDTGRKRLWLFKVRKRFIELHSYSKCGDLKVQQLNIQK